MDLPDPRRGPCRPLFLVVAASLLACEPRQASGQLFISPDSLTAVERHRNVLALENVPEGVQEYSWYRGAEDSAETMIISFRPPDSKVPGPWYSNLVTVTSKGYLSFRMCTLNDTGNYTVRVDTGNGTQRATGWLEVLELGPAPVISANASSVVENLDSVAAECHTNASHIEWYRNSVPISASQRIAISADGRTLVIRRVSRHDRTLECVIQRYESFPDILQKSDTVSLTVACECSGGVGGREARGKAFLGRGHEAGRSGEPASLLGPGSNPGSGSSALDPELHPPHSAPCCTRFSRGTRVPISVISNGPWEVTELWLCREGAAYKKAVLRGSV
ncbi:carcinoembryonic antigen-related cell adhesion molecule 18 isoform X1 [Marmota marmota marmota]|uniref:carcinoembryonic antigen-related cell adhesion molecule 18 isoform X1 n=1 Tax=Marmota marmota marmota TaxID=9994 RepID=UPI002092A7F9|nr:carcinoembryonic antigen-related cell adhesion molecule 18 isoform X1 [Marmota marmota marmota]